MRPLHTTREWPKKPIGLIIAEKIVLGICYVMLAVVPLTMIFGLAYIFYGIFRKLTG